MEHYKILKRGIEMQHGNGKREGFVLKDCYIEHYLIREIDRDSTSVRYLTVFDCAGELVVSTRWVRPHDIVCKGEIVNKDGSEREYMYVDASVRIDYE